MRAGIWKDCLEKWRLFGTTRRRKNTVFLRGHLAIYLSGYLFIYLSTMEEESLAESRTEMKYFVEAGKETVTQQG